VVLSGSDASLWMTLMQDVEVIHRNKTRKLVELLKRWKAIGCKWLYKMKQDENDQVDRYQARLVVKGYA